MPGVRARVSSIAALLCGAMGASCDHSAPLATDAEVETSADASIADASSVSITQPVYSDASLAGAGVTYGSVFTGGEYNLGPVDWNETRFHNACAASTKYLPAVRQVEGQLLAGVWSYLSLPQSYCDTCIQVQTDQGKSAVLRVVTYGETTVNSLDLSPEAYALLNSGEYPRTMSWQLTECPDTGPLLYEFKTGSNAYWTGFWVRNARVPITTVEVLSLRHAYAATSRDTDGSFVDPVGFGTGTFSIRVTTMDGQQIVDTFAQPTSGLAGSLLAGRSNF